MSSQKLPSYLRTYRRRAGLSQDEVAYLLGTRDGSKACRYERWRRTPPLETALAYEVIFQTPARELFAGVFEQVERQVKTRARALHRRLSQAELGRFTDRKAEHLASLLSASRVAG